MTVIDQSYAQKPGDIELDQAFLVIIHPLLSKLGTGTELTTPLLIDWAKDTSISKPGVLSSITTKFGSEFQFILHDVAVQLIRLTRYFSNKPRGLKYRWGGNFLAYQNQRVLTPIRVKLQCSGHRSAIKPCLRWQSWHPSEKTFKKGRSLLGPLYDIKCLELDDKLMTGHSILIIFYQAFQRVPQYLGHLITTDIFLKFYTSAGYGSRVVEALAPALPKWG